AGWRWTPGRGWPARGATHSRKDGSFGAQARRRYPPLDEERPSGSSSSHSASKLMWPIVVDSPRWRWQIDHDRAANQPRPALASQSLATLSGSPLDALATKSASVAVSSLAETALHASTIGWLSFDLLTSGTTFCAANMLFGSSSETNLFFAIEESVEKM